MAVKGRRAVASISVTQILSGRGGGFRVVEGEKTTALRNAVTITCQVGAECPGKDAREQDRWNHVTQKGSSNTIS